MPRYYCDYCDVYLTHDSTAVRKAHNTGRKHKVRQRRRFSESGVKAFFSNFSRPERRARLLRAV